MTASQRPSADDIAATLRSRIRDGHLEAGTKLPTQAELAEEFGVERATVRQALRALHEAGWLANAGRGSPPTVAEPPAGGQEPQPTLVALAPRLEAAFAEPRVRIDAACLTAETLLLAMHAPMALVESGAVRPESVEVRILLPHRDVRLLYPSPADGWGADAAVDEAVHRRSVAQYDAQLTVLRQYFRTLRADHGIPAVVRFRTVPNTPPQKVYLLNGTEALLAFYIPARRTVDVQSEPRELWDAWGTRSLLFRHHAAHGERDALFVAEAQKWFDAVWEMQGPDLREP
ncbi:winged helix-turn-helix domain-containing protein [Streptomyces sp. NPDC052610]|uniref:winged helix-turn-helix domain-containing protein n=1 Tax=Streptomyces sp. NPDC052610 TaxID=3154952 RepID=UPI00343EB4F1